MWNNRETKHGEAIITPADWSESSNAPRSATVEDADITDGCFVEVFPDAESQEDFAAAEAFAELTVAAGSFTVSVKNRPAESITVKYCIIP
jgi:hypothetical protein